MKGKIDRGGTLWIERAGNRMVQCWCKIGGFTPEEPYYTCSHDCPHFGEPEAGDDFVREPESESDNMMFFKPVPNGKTELHICHGIVLTFDEFTDERSVT